VTGVGARVQAAATAVTLPQRDAAAVRDWRATVQNSCSTDANCVKEALLFTSVHSTLPAIDDSTAAPLYTELHVQNEGVSKAVVATVCVRVCDHESGGRVAAAIAQS
jgi:hypothetical protein